MLNDTVTPEKADCGFRRWENGEQSATWLGDVAKTAASNARRETLARAANQNTRTLNLHKLCYTNAASVLRGEHGKPEALPSASYVKGNAALNVTLIEYI